MTARGREGDLGMIASSSCQEGEEKEEKKKKSGSTCPSSARRKIGGGDEGQTKNAWGVRLLSAGKKRRKEKQGSSRHRLLHAGARKEFKESANGGGKRIPDVRPGLWSRLLFGHEGREGGERVYLLTVKRVDIFGRGKTGERGGSGAGFCPRTPAEKEEKGKKTAPPFFHLPHSPS